ncbi:MAG TPA: metal-sulfur cluster assembly factor [Longimicrobiales bacterium]|nr:metal-sulfur cluster assembly factor [Longimicrobiales bacterium]
MSLNVPLPTVPTRARVPAHIAAPRDEGAEPRAGSAEGAAVEHSGGPSPHCRAPFDAASVPAEALPLWNALRDVLDPELPISVVDMGLIYDVRLEGGTAEVTLTYTATGCPCVDFIRTDITTRLLAEPGVDAVALHEVWSPPWTRARMTDEGRAALRALGVAA